MKEEKLIAAQEENSGAPVEMPAGAAVAAATCAEEGAESPQAVTDEAGGEASESPGDVAAGEVSAPAEDAGGSGPDLEAMLAEAENRGYLRGRNEQIERLMKQPGLLERPSASRQADAVGPDGQTFDSQPMILSNPRVSIWDR